MKFSRRMLSIVIIVEVIVMVMILGLAIYYFFWGQDQMGQAERLIITEIIPSGTLILETMAPASPLEYTPTLPPSPSQTISPAATEIPPTPEPIITHTVQMGEILSVIAEQYKVDVEDILAINSQITDANLIQDGDTILIPVTSPELILELSATPDPDNPRPYTGISYITSDTTELLTVYPLTATAADDRLILHYQSGAYVDRNWGQILDALTEAYQFVEERIGSSFDSPLKLYLAGSLFRDDENLRGFTQSGLYRSFMLVDGSGSLGEQTYLFAHEFTHIFAYHQWGRYHSPMIHEGLATYLPQVFLMESTEYLPLDDICVAASEAGRLVPMATLAAQSKYGPPYFEGHIRSFLYYNQSACFVKYLIEEYGLEFFGQVFSSGNYPGVYGKNLAELDAEWQASLTDRSISFDPLLFVASIDRVAAGYEDYFDRVSGGRHANFQAYLILDDARLAVDSGELERANQLLDTYYSLIAQ
jgi:LysM repeat protein